MAQNQPFSSTHLPFRLSYHILLFSLTKVITLSIIPKCSLFCLTRNVFELAITSHNFFRAYLSIILVFLVLKAYQILNRALFKFRSTDTHQQGRQYSYESGCRCWGNYLTSAIQVFVKHWNLHLPKTRPAVVTGIWSEIPEILCVEITDELLRITGHMNNFFLREFVFYVFQPRLKYSNPRHLYCLMLI